MCLMISIVSNVNAQEWRWSYNTPNMAQGSSGGFNKYISSEIVLYKKENNFFLKIDGSNDICKNKNVEKLEIIESVVNLIVSHAVKFCGKLQYKFKLNDLSGYEEEYSNEKWVTTAANNSMKYLGGSSVNLLSKNILEKNSIPTSLAVNGKSELPNLLPTSIEKKQEEPLLTASISRVQDIDSRLQEARLNSQLKVQEPLLIERKVKEEQQSSLESQLKEELKLAEEAELTKQKQLALEAQQKELIRLAEAAKAAELVQLTRMKELEAIAEVAKSKDLELAKLKEELARFQEQNAKQKLVAANRRAFVVGNDSYNQVSKLINSREDARTVAENLSRVGYNVTTKLDMTEREMRTAWRVFKSQVQPGDEVAFFYAGHGVQLGNTNYLLPVDVSHENEEQIKDEGLPLQRILDDLSDRKARFTIAMVDACRDNPFVGNGRNIGGTSRGLAPTTAATGQMIIFSAGTGQQALDRLGPQDKNKNGVFTRVFVKEMLKPGISVDRVVRNVRNEVVELARSIGHEQVPAIYDQVVGEFFFNK